MCGIIGFSSSQPFSEDALRKLTSRLTHRGPDGQGVYHSRGGSPHVALGHRRLSVIDPAGGEQPMYSEERTIVVVFNGEIYNFRELRTQLEACGHRFGTRSDTEVIVHGYEEWGAGVADKLEGMFAFGVYDEKQTRLFLARDRMGQKPLYYFVLQGQLGFSSEIAPLREHLGSCRLSRQAIGEYLTHGFVTGEATGWEHIHKLLPGHALVWENGEATARAYWTLPQPTEVSRSDPRELEEELDQRLRSAVKRRLVSDVPLGAFLSGGLDSSLVVAMMARETEGDVETFSVGFNDPSYDESGNARAMASHLGVRHTQEHVDLTEPGDLDEVIQGFGEPFGDSSAIPTLALSRATRRRVTVALSGDGADELFGGYQRYLARKLAGWYLCMPRPLREAVRAVETRRREGVEYYGSSVGKKARLFLALAQRVDRGIEGLPTFLSPEEIHSLFPQWESPLATYPQRLTETLRGGEGVLSRMMWLDLLTYLPDDILTKVDRMSMHCSLEVRSPFMDRQVVEFAQGVPERCKVRGMTTKYLLKRVGQRYLPRDVVHRRKHGFSVPLGRWFQGRLGDVLRGWAVELSPAVNPVPILAWLEEHRAGARDHGHRLWFLLVLCYWVRQVGEPSAP